MAHANNNNKDMDDSELFDYLDREINFNQFTKGLDLSYFSKYQPDLGFKVCLEGVHNSPQGEIVVCIFSLFDRYARGDQTPTKFLAAQIDWTGPKGQILFLDWWSQFKNIRPDSHTVLLVESFTAKLTGNEIIF